MIAASLISECGWLAGELMWLVPQECGSLLKAVRVNSPVLYSRVKQIVDNASADSGKWADVPKESKQRMGCLLVDLENIERARKK